MSAHPRRRFLMAGAAAMAGAATVGCGGSAPAPQPDQAASPGTSGDVSLLMQFSGLIMHAAWPAGHASTPGAWDALLLGSTHRPQLRVRLSDLDNPQGHRDDRYHPGFGVWDLANTDVIVHVDGVTRGAVTTVSGLRQPSSVCPDPSSSGDISWIADLSSVLPGDVVVRPELGADSTSLVAGGDLRARVRLSTGQVYAGPASNPAFDGLTVKFSGSSHPEQFLADLVRYETPPSRAVALELVPFGQASGTRLDLRAGQQVVAYVEHTDPSAALHGPPNDVDAFAARHFDPYLAALENAQPLELTFGCCPTLAGQSCDPPYYCFQSRGGHR